MTVHERGPRLDGTSRAPVPSVCTTQAGGMGLGLARSRVMIAAHGGWMRATRPPAQGLTVSCPLPAVSPGRSATPDHRPRAPAVMDSRSRQVTGQEVPVHWE